MNWNELHLIKGKNIYLAYYYPTANLRIINNAAYNVLFPLNKGETKNEIAEFPKNTKAFSFIQSLYKSLDTKRIKRLKNENSRKIISRITLHIANDCNLRCRYCFAGGGNYGQIRNLMSEYTARDFVDFCIREFDVVEKIVFFGGEPMLNIKAMEIVCSRFKFYKEKGQLSVLPKFVIITNGTILTPSALQFIKENIFSITISIDGPKEVNDINRIYQNGKGSYEKIAQFIHTILQETNVNIRYEATFTQAHIDAHYSYEDITKHLNSTFGIKGIIVNEKGLNANYLLDYWNSIDKEYLEKTKFEYLPCDFWNILRAIIYKRENAMCPVIDKAFAVGADGTIYMCQMLNGIKECELGNINDSNIYNSPLLYKPFDTNIELKENEKCKECWVQNLCGGCATQKFFDTKTNKLMKEPNPDFCNVVKQCIEKVLLIIASVHKTPELWSVLLQKGKWINN